MIIIKRDKLVQLVLKTNTKLTNWDKQQTRNVTRNVTSKTQINVHTSPKSEFPLCAQAITIYFYTEESGEIRQMPRWAESLQGAQVNTMVLTPNMSVCVFHVWQDWPEKQINPNCCFFYFDRFETNKSFVHTTVNPLKIIHWIMLSIIMVSCKR